MDYIIYQLQDGSKIKKLLQNLTAENNEYLLSLIISEGQESREDGWFWFRLQPKPQWSQESRDQRVLSQVYSGSIGWPQLLTTGCSWQGNYFQQKKKESELKIETSSRKWHIVCQLSSLPNLRTFSSPKKEMLKNFALQNTLSRESTDKAQTKRNIFKRHIWYTEKNT